MSKIPPHNANLKDRQPCRAHQGISRTISAKADRLCDNHRVILLDPRWALVIGDRDTYDVIKLSYRWSCNCSWGRYKSHEGDCSHVLAVRRAFKRPRSQAPVARLAELLHNALNSMEVA